MFLRDQHVSVPEVIEERQQKTIRRIMDSKNKVAPNNSEAVVTPHRPTGWRAHSLFVKPIGAVKILLSYVVLFIGSAGELLPGIFDHTTRYRGVTDLCRHIYALLGSTKPQQ